MRGAMSAITRLATSIAATTLLLLGACHSTPDDTSGSGGGGTSATGGAAGGGGSATGDQPTWETLASYLRGHREAGTMHGFAMQVYSADDQLLFELEEGACATDGPCPLGSPPYTVDLVTGVASSTKWITSAVTLAAFEEAVSAKKVESLSAALDTPISKVLTCGGGLPASVAGITPRHLLSFTSGLLPDHPCVGKASYDGQPATLQTCACAILADSAAAMVGSPSEGTAKKNAHPPGTTFKYGSTHHTVMAAAVEKVTGEPWAETFARLVTAPLGVSWAYGPPTAAANPNMAGSIRASVAEYARFVRAIYHDGLGGPRTLLSAEAVAEQERSQMPPGVTPLLTPQPGLEYGLNNWRFCFETPTDLAFLTSGEALVIDTSCGATFAVGHSGKGGFVPWIDVAQGYYAVYAMREDSPGDDATYTGAEIDLAANIRLLTSLIMAKHPAPYAP